MSYSKPANTFRFCATANGAAARTGLGSPTFGDDFAFCSRRNRLVLEHRTQHGPSRISDGFCHLSFCEFGGADISDVYLCVITHDFRGDHVKEIFSPVGNFCRKRTSAHFLATRFEKREFIFFHSIVAWCRYFFSGRKCGNVSQAKINTNCRSFTVFRFRQFNRDIDIPTPARIGREIPRFRFSIFRKWSRIPKMISLVHKFQNTIIKFCRSSKSSYWYPIKISFVRSKTWSFWKTCITSNRKFAANCIDSIGVQSKFFRNTTAKFSQIKCGWSHSNTPSLPPIEGLAINLTTIVPHKIDSTCLSTKSASRRRTSVFYSISICEKHEVGRSSVVPDGRSRACWMHQHLAGSILLTLYYPMVK